jgi:hypothetical protein
MLAKKYFLFLIVSFAFSVGFAQFSQSDTLKITTYNTLNYGFSSSASCPTLITSNKNEYLKTILRYENPDLIGLVKMKASPASFTTNYVIQNVFDSICLGCYNHTPFTNYSGYSKEDMVYYKTAKLKYVSTQTIYAADSTISDINLHTFYYNDSNLVANSDTAFLRIILVHLKSGSNYAANRATQINGATAWLNNNITQPGNYIIMGDFNVQSSTEACFQALVNSSNTNTRFYDPPNQLGNWAGNPALFANYLTEDTRKVDPGDCGANSGLDTRFVHILCTQPLMQGTAFAKYISGSYKVVGQDGNHINKALTDLPTNTAVPPQVLNALYFMSNHLPVSIKVMVNKAPSIATNAGYTLQSNTKFTIHPNPFEAEAIITFSTDIKSARINVINLLGIQVKSFHFSGKEFMLKKNDLTPGIYFIEVIAIEDTTERSTKNRGIQKISIE